MTMTIDMTAIDPTTIIVGPAGQTLAEAAAAEQAELYVGGYQVRPRPCGSLPPGATRSASGYIVLADGTASSYYGADVEAELVALAAERGRGETLAVDGEIWGGAYVIVSHPRTRERGFLAVRFDEARYPALAEACRVIASEDQDGDDAAVIEEPELSIGEELAALPADLRRVAERVEQLDEIEPAPGWEERAIERARRPTS